MINVQVDLSKVLGDARNQGQRPTCLAFTASDLNAAANSTDHLSVEYLCHHAAKYTPQWTSGGGYTVDAIFKAVHKPGQPLDSLYQYNHSDPNAPSVQPPANLTPLYSSLAKQQGLTVQEVFAAVNAQKIVGVVLAVTNSLFRPVSGEVVYDAMVLPGQYHAMVAVGVGSHKVTNESYLLLRNSWGTKWGVDGHAWVPRSHLDLHLIDGITF